MSEVVKGSPVIRLPRRPRQLVAGRICTEPGCDTILSVYNKQQYCYVHRVPRKPRTRGKP
jgi:hypothetical protein